VCYKEILVSSKIRVLPSGTYSQTQDLENFALAYRSLQWRGERYDGTSTRTGLLQSKKIKTALKDNAKK